VSKKKSAKKKTRPAATSRRKPASRKRSAARKRPLRPARTVQLKPIKVLIDRAIADLQKLPPTEATDTTLRHLQSCTMAFEDICDPATPGGCAPTMEFPRGALATSR
jgi:hypothetical protein